MRDCSREYFVKVILNFKILALNGLSQISH